VPEKSKRQVYALGAQEHVACAEALDKRPSANVSSSNHPCWPSLVVALVVRLVVVVMVLFCV